MTLIVAHTVSNGIRLSSDLRVTNPDAVRPPSLLTAALKAVIVHPQMCVAYAGKPVEAAFDALRGLRLTANLPIEIGPVSEALLDLHRTLDLDFLIATLQPTRLLQVKGGKAETVTSGWIGSGKAFEAFQAVFTARVSVDPRFADYLAREHPERDPADWASPFIDPRLADTMSESEAADLAIGERAMRAMQTVVMSDLSEVGEDAIFAVPRSGVFGYLEKSLASTGRPRPTHAGVNPLQAGSAAHGDFSYAVLTPQENGIGVIGMYFLEGQLGLLHYPMKLDRPQQYAGVSATEFKHAVHEDHGVRLSGIGLGV